MVKKGEDDNEADNYKLVRVGHIFRRQNGKEEGVATSWEDELPRYTPHTRKWKWRWRCYLLVMVATPRGILGVALLKGGEE